MFAQLSRLRSALIRRMENRRAVNGLQGLNDYLLGDLGVRRDEIENLVRHGLDETY